MSCEIGIDIGGTFTDVVCRLPSGAIRLLKLPTTRGDPSEAVLAALELARQQWGVDPAVNRPLCPRHYGGDQRRA